MNDRFDGFALTALIAGILAVLFCWLLIVNFVLIMLSVVLGIVALRSTKLRKTRGRKAAIAAIILGGIGLLLGVAVYIFLFSYTNQLLAGNLDVPMSSIEWPFKTAGPGVIEGGHMYINFSLDEHASLIVKQISVGRDCADWWTIRHDNQTTTTLTSGQDYQLLLKCITEKPFVRASFNITYEEGGEQATIRGAAVAAQPAADDK